MERKLKKALLSTIDSYNTLLKQLDDPAITPARTAELMAAKDVLLQVLQHFADAEYLECIDGQWRIKVIVVMDRSVDS